LEVLLAQRCLHDPANRFVVIQDQNANLARAVESTLVLARAARTGFDLAGDRQRNAGFHFRTDRKSYHGLTPHCAGGPPASRFGPIRGCKKGTGSKSSRCLSPFYRLPLCSGYHDTTRSRALRTARSSLSARNGFATMVQLPLPRLWRANSSLT